MELQTQAFATHVDGPNPLQLIVEPAVVLNNNVSVSSPRTLVSLTPNSTNFVYFDLSVNAVRLNSSSFPNQAIPIATVNTGGATVLGISDDRPDFLLIASPGIPLVNAPGVPLNVQNFGFLGWGTGATLQVVSGTQTGYIVTVTAGNSPSFQPSITLTFNSGYIDPPMTIVQMTGGTAMKADFLVANTIAQQTLTLDDLPLAGTSYVLSIFNLGQ